MYNDDGYLVSVKDADNQVTQVERDTEGSPTAITGPFGQRTELLLDTNGYLERIQPPLGSPHLFEYDGDGGLLTRYTDPRGNNTEIQYDSMGRLARHDDAANGFRTFGRVETGSDYIVSMTTALGQTREVEVKTEAWGERLLIERSPDSIETRTRLLIDGRIEQTLPSGMVLTTVEAGDPRWALESSYIKTLWEDSPAGKRMTVERTKEAVLSDPDDLSSLQTLTETLLINEKEYILVYDADVRTLTMTSPAGRTFRYRIDEQGRFTQYQLGNLSPVNFQFNEAGGLAGISQGEGIEERVSSFSYNQNGHNSSLTDPLGRTTSFGVDVLGRETSVTFPGSLPLQFEYDDNDNLTAVTPPGRPAHRFTYTPRDDVESYDPPMIGGQSMTTSVVYDTDGELMRATLPDGRSITYSFQQGSCRCGNLQAMTTDRGDFTYEYDPTTRQRTSITTPENEVLRYLYEGDYHRQTEWQGTINGAVDVTYDNFFRVTSRRINGLPHATYQFDDDGVITQADSYRIEWGPDLPLLAGTVLGVVTDTYDYSDFGEVTLYSCLSNGTEVFRTEYTHDKLGRVVSLQESIQGEESLYEYDYDPAYRLTEVRKGAATIFSCTYDSNENRTLIENRMKALSASYDAQDRLESFGSNTYAHSPNGEVTTLTGTLGVTRFDYDALGNLTGCDLPDGRRIDYVLDGQDRRIGKKVDGVLVQGFLYRNQLNPVAELDGAGNLVSRLVYATHSVAPDFMVRDSVTYRIIRDHLGSPRLVINTTTGEVVQRMDYDPLGRVSMDTNPGFQPFGFAGGIYDRDTGLVQFGSREYDPTTGRWTSKDPNLFGGGSNVYAYAENDPVNLVDPFGAQAEGAGGAPIPSGEWGEMLKEASKKIHNLADEALKKIRSEEAGKAARRKLEERARQAARKLERLARPGRSSQRALQKSVEEAAKHSTKRCSPIYFLLPGTEQILRKGRCMKNPYLPDCEARRT